MDLKIEKRSLNNQEVNLLFEEIKKFPNPLTDKKTWADFKLVYVLKSKNDLIGVCGITQLNNWVKLGPFVVLKKYHKQGYGIKILKAITKDYLHSNLFIGSRNPVVASIAIHLGFQEIASSWLLPSTVKIYLIKSILKALNFSYFKELIRKRSVQEGQYRYFLKRIET